MNDDRRKAEELRKLAWRVFNDWNDKTPIDNQKLERAIETAIRQARLEENLACEALCKEEALQCDRYNNAERTFSCEVCAVLIAKRREDGDL